VKNKSNKTHNTLSNLNKTDRKMVSSMVGMTNKYGPVIHPSQTTIGKKAGRSRITANRITQKLSALGIIKKINRGVKKTCLYMFPQEVYFDVELRKSLRHLIPAFWFAPTALLFSLAGPSQKSDTQDNIYNNTQRFGTATSAHSLSEIKGQSDSHAYRDSSDPFSCLFLNNLSTNHSKEWQTIYGEPQWHFESASLHKKGHGIVAEQAVSDIIEEIFGSTSTESSAMDKRYDNDEETRSPFKYVSSEREEQERSSVKKIYSTKSTKDHLAELHNQQDRVNNEPEQKRIENMARLMEQRDTNPFAQFALTALRNQRNDA